MSYRERGRDHVFRLTEEMERQRIQKEFERQLKAADQEYAELTSRKQELIERYGEDLGNLIHLYNPNKNDGVVRLNGSWIPTREILPRLAISLVKNLDTLPKDLRAVFLVQFLSDLSKK